MRELRRLIPSFAYIALRLFAVKPPVYEPVKIFYNKAVITKLVGNIVMRGEKFVLLDVQGVGYRVFVGSSTQNALASAKEHVTLWTHLYVRDDTHELYGFPTFQEMEFFERLIRISGVGPRSAIAILGIAPLDILQKAIAAGDKSYLTRVSGIGKRMAEKIIVELRDTLASGLSSEEAGRSLKDDEDVFEALRTLGYSRAEANEALARVAREIEGKEARLKTALANLGKA